MQLLYKINLYVISSHAKNVCPTFVYSWSFAFKLQGYVGMYYTGEIRAFKNKLVYLTTYNFVVLDQMRVGKKLYTQF